MNKEEVPQTFEDFKIEYCNNCKSNDWYCSGECYFLERARRVNFEFIQKSYMRNDGDLRKVYIAIRNKKND